MRTKSRPAPATKPPANFDEVKRRFIRQNRELAKNNSTQSLRIRSLELEVSRLLADNLDLREKVLLLEHELYQARNQVSGDAVRRVREELQAKIAELSGLVTGLDDAVTEGGSAEPPPREKKPIEGQWRERQPLTEVMRETAMPTITEDKLYPRRTLGADEIQAIRLSDHSSNESPDLGPPPVAHFDYRDPVKAPQSPSATRTSPVEEEEEVLPGLGINLETRRKRKAGRPNLEIRRRSILPQSPGKQDGEGSTILRTGAKRKLADRDMDKPIRPLVKDDFTFSRRAASQDSKAAETQITATSPKEQAHSADQQNAEQSVPEIKPARKILGDKSVNMSPRKVGARRDKSLKDGEKAEKPSAETPASTLQARARARRVSSLPLPSPPRESVVEHVDPAPPSDPKTATLPPITPAPPDLFSPATSEPSAKGDDGRAGTPPPSDLSTMSVATDGGTRPSRRARAAVNYAEPSLTAKMRRPGKQMVDAISGLHHPRQVMNVSSEKKAPTSVSRSVSIKKEPEDDDDDAWKRAPSAEPVLAASPLGQKVSEGSSDPLATEDTTDQEPAKRTEPSAASATISALMAGSRKRRTASQTEQPLGTDMEAAVKRMEELELYDFKESSSPVSAASTAAGTAASTGQGQAGAAGKGKGHRRHSSAPRDLGANGTSTSTGPDTGKGTGTGTKQAASVGGSLAGAGRAERAASRRRSMML
jgi:hypothetical protein